MDNHVENCKGRPLSHLANRKTRARLNENAILTSPPPVLLFIRYHFHSFSTRA